MPEIANNNAVNNVPVQTVKNQTIQPDANQKVEARNTNFAKELNAEDALIEGVAHQAGATEAAVSAGKLMSTVGGLIPGVGGSLSNVSMLQMQRAIQQETMMVTTASNVMKAKHEAQMSVVRNVKGG